MGIKKERIVWIDQLRSIAFLFVIIGHVALPKETKSLIYSFHMPLFFLISGLTLNREKLINMPFFDYLKKQVKSLVIPYFWLSFICYPLWYYAFKVLTNSKDSVFDIFLGIFAGDGRIQLQTSNALWFLLVLFLGNILYFALLKLTKGNNTLLFISVVVCAILGFIDKGFAQIWNFNVAFTAVVMLYIGNVFMDYYKNSNFFKQKHNFCYCMKVFGLVILFLAIGIGSHTMNGRISMTANKFGKSLFLFYITAIAFSAVLTLLIMHLPKLKIITLIGQNTLFYVGLHIPIIRILERQFPDVFSHYKYSLLLAVALYFCLLPLALLCKKLAPYVCGVSIDCNTKFYNVFKVLAVMWCSVIPYYTFLLQFGFTIHSILFDVISMAVLAVLSILFVFVTNKWVPIIYLNDKNKLLVK